MKKAKLKGLISKDNRHVIMITKEQSFPVLFFKFLLGCGLVNDPEQYSEDIKSVSSHVEHYKNLDYEIDVAFSKETIFLIIRTEKPKSELMRGIEKIVEIKK